MNEKIKESVIKILNELSKYKKNILINGLYKRHILKHNSKTKDYDFAANIGIEYILIKNKKY